MPRRMVLKPRMSIVGFPSEEDGEFYSSSSGGDDSLRGIADYEPMQTALIVGTTVDIGSIRQNSKEG
jgi:hypothetical protein